MINITEIGSKYDDTYYQKYMQWNATSPRSISYAEWLEMILKGRDAALANLHIELENEKILRGKYEMRYSNLQSEITKITIFYANELHPRIEEALLYAAVHPESD